MKQAQKYTEEWLTKNDVDPENVEYTHVILMMESYARETAIEFVKWMDKQGIANLFRDDNKKMDYFDTEKMFDKWFTNKAQQK